MPLEVAALLHLTFRLQLGLSKSTTWMNSYGSFIRGGPGFVAAARSWGGESWGALACPSCQSAAEEVSDLDSSNGSEESTTLGLSETEKNHIPSIRLISDQAGNGFCLQCVPSSVSVQLCSDGNITFWWSFGWFLSVRDSFTHPPFHPCRWLLSDHESAALRQWKWGLLFLSFSSL